MNTNMPSLKSAISEEKNWYPGQQLSSRTLGGSPARERTAVDCWLSLKLSTERVKGRWYQCLLHPGLIVFVLVWDQHILIPNTPNVIALIYGCVALRHIWPVDDPLRGVEGCRIFCLVCLPCCQYLCFVAMNNTQEDHHLCPVTPALLPTHGDIFIIGTSILPVKQIINYKWLPKLKFKK